MMDEGSIRRGEQGAGSGEKKERPSILDHIVLDQKVAQDRDLLDGSH